MYTFAKTNIILTVVAVGCRWNNSRKCCI